MRLSAHVSRHGIDSFTREDLLLVTSKVSLDPNRLVLVGGQALETWGVFFDVLAPTGDRHPLTEDADWLGDAADATWLCGLLGRDSTELQIAKIDDQGPSSAIAFLRTQDGRVLMMDFLHSVIGLQEKEIRELAIPVKVDGGEMHVLHPLLCLASRLANLELLPSKRQGNGPMQAQWAIDIVRAYLALAYTKSLEEGSPRQVIRAAHRVAEMAEYKSGRYCYLTYGLDPLSAVTPELVKAVNGRFATDDWPATVARINSKRERWLEIATRAKPHLKKPC